MPTYLLKPTNQQLTVKTYIRHDAITVFTKQTTTRTERICIKPRHLEEEGFRALTHQPA